MDHDEVLTTFDRQMRREARPDGPGTRVERVGAVVRQVTPEHGWNGVLWSGLDPAGADADATVAEQVRYFTSIGREFEWKLYSHDLPGDLADRLLAAGFLPEPEEAVLVAGTRELSTDIDLPHGVRLVPVTDAAGIDLVAAVHERVFGSDFARFRQQMLDQLAGRPDTVEIVLAMAGDEPVSAARLEMVPGTGFAGLWGGGTLPAWRGRGIYRALIAYRVRIAAERGYRYLQVDASGRSSPILERLGFVRLGTTTPYVYRP